MEINGDTCVIERANNSQLPEILRFAHENFDKEETMMKSLRANNFLTKQDEELLRLDHERLLKAIFEQSPCLVAIHGKSRKIIGVNLMILSKNPKLDDEENGVAAAFSNNRPQTKLMQEYFEYLSEISEQADLYKRFPSAKAGVEFYAIAVDKDHRCKGLAKLLMAEGISFARTLEDVGFVFGAYTSMYSKRAAEKLGLKSLLDVDLLKYKDTEGKLIFQDTEPHNIVSVMALEIS